MKTLTQFCLARAAGGAQKDNQKIFIWVRRNMKIKMQAIEEMLTILKSNPNVLGLVEHGSPHKSDNYVTGDYDLFVILQNKDHDVESLHFYISNIPIDLNIKTLREIQKLKFAKGFDIALLDGRVIFNPTGKVSQELRKLKGRQKKYQPKKLSEHSIAFTRHGHKHVFNKIKGRLDNMPLFCEFLLGANIYWLVQTYFNVRNIPFGGEKDSLNYLKTNEPDIYKGIKDFYTATSLQHRLEISKMLTELILRPVDGRWKDDEILAFGNKGTKDLQKKGKELFQKLFYQQ